jgi:hypothetical protein
LHLLHEKLDPSTSIHSVGITEEQTLQILEQSIRQLKDAA